ncbi:MAG: TIGR00303 family protein [Cyanobacteria bacterium]|nr:TIGR00303 family protein [Cyanobacteriota bacterium]
MLRVHTQSLQGQQWLRRYWGHRPQLACILGFTETGLIPGISAAGASPADRRTTAIADAEFLYYGPQAQPTYPLPPLVSGVSPAWVTHALIAAQRIPLQLFDSGLPVPPPVPHINLGGRPAQCLTTGQALPLATVQTLFLQGKRWGQRLARQSSGSYVVLGECVVGGTTTALALLLGLGIPAGNRVNSSHPTCNHDQKHQVVAQGLDHWRKQVSGTDPIDPLKLVAAIGDPMQVVAAAMALTASCYGGVLLAGGAQMLAVYALARAIAAYHHLRWYPGRIMVGTTRWVIEDGTSDAVGLAQLVGDAALISTQLSFQTSRYPQLRCYEQGFVKEGMAAGGSAIAATLYQNWDQAQLLHCIEALLGRVSDG